MSVMRVMATVVGKTVVVDSDVRLPEGSRVELVLRATNDDETPTWDVTDEDWAELETRQRRPRASLPRSRSPSCGP